MRDFPKIQRTDSKETRGQMLWRVCVIVLSLFFSVTYNIAEGQKIPGTSDISDNASEPSRDVSDQLLASELPDSTIRQTLTGAEIRRLHPVFQSHVARFRLLGDSPDPVRTHQDFPSPPVSVRHDALIFATDFQAILGEGISLHTIWNTFATARLTTEELSRLAGLPAVRYVDPGDTFHPATDISLPATGAHLVHNGLINSTPYRGDGALVAIFDTGIDWTHLDFRDPEDTTRSTIAYLWDTTLEVEGQERSPQGDSCCDYGVEYTREEINAALRGNGEIRSQDTRGHGTLVTGIAAGTGTQYPGIAPEAQLIVIRGGEATFSPVDIINGLYYARMKSSELGKPVVVNLSLGGHRGAHDGTSPVEIAIDELSADPGFIVVASAGNTGNNPVHVDGTIPSGETAEIALVVPEYTPNDDDLDNFFSFDLWISGPDEVDVSVKTPNDRSEGLWHDGDSFSEDTGDGTIQISNDISPHNEDRRLSFSVYDRDEDVPPAEGVWTFTVGNEGASPLEYDGWLVSRSGSLSGVSWVDGSTSSTVTVPATANRAIGAGSYVTRWRWSSDEGESHSYGDSDRTGDISAFSGRGPTRDGRLKPDLAAPGQGIISAISAGMSGPQPSRRAPGGRHRLSQGTSLAAAHITGIVALILGAVPQLTYDDLYEILTSSSNRDDFTGPEPDMVWGHGKLNALSAMAAAIGETLMPVHEVLRYDEPGDSDYATLAGDEALGLRFTSNLNGLLTGITMSVPPVDNNPIRGDGTIRLQIFDEEDGKPGRSVGEISHPVSRLVPNTAVYLNLLEAEIEVTHSRDYFLTLSLEDSDGHIRVETDDGSAGNDRSFVYDPTDEEWYLLGTPESGLDAVNLRLRPEVAGIPVEVVGTAPVLMTYPKAIVDGADVQLFWEAESHVELDGFEIEQQLEGSFIPIGYVAAVWSADETVQYVFTVSNLVPGQHVFRVNVLMEDALTYSLSPVSVEVTLGEAYHLTGASPNPFHDETTFSLTIAQEQEVEITVYNTLGQRMAVLFSGHLEADRTHQFRFQPDTLPSGIYFFRADGEFFTTSGDAVYIRR